MIKVRLARGGKKNNPHYRIVAIESSKKLTGEALAVLGFWHPQKKTIKVDKNGILDWEKKGAQVSAAVKALLK